MTAVNPTPRQRPRDPFSEAMAAALAAGPTPLEREEARACRAARRANRRAAVRRLFESPTVMVWGDRALWALCVVVVVFTVAVPISEAL